MVGGIGGRGPRIIPSQIQKKSAVNRRSGARGVIEESGVGVKRSGTQSAKRAVQMHKRRVALAIAKNQTIMGGGEV